MMRSASISMLKFQSTPLSRGETQRLRAAVLLDIISIHSPLTRGDSSSSEPFGIRIISIHSPLTRGDDHRLSIISRRPFISIHSPLTRGDRSRSPTVTAYLNFNPLPSHEGRPSGCGPPFFWILFQSTPLSRGETQPFLPAFSANVISIHSPLTRGDGLNHLRDRRY